MKPDWVPALDALGRALLTDGRLDRAQAAFERALTINPGDPIGRLGLARVARPAETVRLPGSTPAPAGAGSPARGAPGEGVSVATPRFV